MGSEDARLLADNAVLFEEYIWPHAAGKARSICRSSRSPGTRCCTAIATRSPLAAMPAVEAVAEARAGAAVETIESSCCGMAGSFGYGADTIDMSLTMAELSLFRPCATQPPETIIVADGTSCRQQIRDGTGRDALHVARVLAMSINAEVPARGLPAPA